MPSTLPSTEVFAFSEPKIKGGEIRVAMNLGPGVLHVLHGTRAVWRNLFERLQAEFEAPAGERLPRAKLVELMRSALAEWEAGGCTQREAAEKRGIQLNTFTMWLAAERKRARHAAPVLKPGGRLL